MPDPQTPNPLAKYRQMRDFAQTAEPRGEHASTGSHRTFVVQKHAASRLHYDFRLEHGGVLVSWAVPKGPSYDPADKRIAVRVEDHPLSYASFEGTIPAKQYGAGCVIVWDDGWWEPIGDPAEGLAKGKLLFKLHGQKLAGLWELVKIAKPGDKQQLWILFKKRGDAFARPRTEYDVVTALPDSVLGKPLAKPASISHRPGPSTSSGSQVSARPASKRSKTSRSSNAVPGAIKGPLPEKMSPQLATLATGVPAAGQWLYEIKFDGYRLMCRIKAGKATLITRGGHDWSARMPGLIDELQSLGLKSAWLDGEIVVLGANGLPDFNALQKSFDRGTSSAGIDYFLFDLPYFEGYDLRAVELIERRRLLKAFLDDKGTEHVRFSADFPGDAAAVLQSACKLGLEGVMAKRSDAPYSSARSDTWLKLKFKLRQEFVVCGYTDRSDGSPQIGSLLLGVYADTGELVSVGSVGTGWSAVEAAELKKKLVKLEIDQAPFVAGAAKPGRWSRRRTGSERWIEPRIVAEVEYAGMTPDGQLRHASYVSMRTDKPATSIRLEIARTPADKKRLSSTAKTSTTAIKVTHGDRVIDASTGLTKLDLVRYYESVADFILPHLEGRPCSLVRAPTGVAGEIFFQKHGERTAIPGLKDMDPALWPGHDALLEVGTAQALVGAAQMNTVEFHTWNSTEKNIDAPDRMIFDLDPGEGTAWQHVQEAATLVGGLLHELGLEAWLKTSGGKGLHVVVPLTPRLDYGTVKDFSRAIVQYLARVIPSRFVARSGASNRVGKLFVDYLRNGHGATTAAAFSARARAGLGVSMPLAWDALPGLESGAHWTVATAREHLSFQTADPWAGYWKKKQTLTAAMKTLGFKAPKARSKGS